MTTRADGAQPAKDHPVLLECLGGPFDGERRIWREGGLTLSIPWPELEPDGRAAFYYVALHRRLGRVWQFDRIDRLVPTP